MNAKTKIRKYQFQQISDSQKTTWNKFEPGLKKWQSKLYDHRQPAAEGIINLLNPTDSQLILDIAAGTGDPGLSIAKMQTGGKVIVTDLSPQMLDIAKENAAKKGITNVEFQACDVSELPFADNTFDGVSCRMGFMFFPDMVLAAQEKLRVLKPNGKLATSVWGRPEQNFWGTAIGNAITQNLKLPNPEPNSPGIFRCGKSDLMTNVLREVGFKNSSVREVICELNCGTAEIYWEIMIEIAAPIVAGLKNADVVMKKKIKKEICEVIPEKYPEGTVIIAGTALLIYGEK